METSKFCFLVISLLAAAGHATFALTEAQLRAIIQSELAVAAHNSAGSSGVGELAAKVEELERSFGEFEAEAGVYMQQHLLKLQETNSLCRTVSSNPIGDLPPPTRNLSWAEYDAVVGNKSVAQTGRSFNGSSLNEINAAVSRAGDREKFTTVVFINHLDRTINNFQMYDRNNSAFNRAPASIAPNTREVFTFAEPTCCFVRTSFSYNIAATNERIGSVVDTEAVDSFALAFLPSYVNLEDYFKTRNGLSRSSQNITQQAGESPRLLVNYQNFYARMAVTAMGNNKLTVVIELIDSPNSYSSARRFVSPPSHVSDDAA